MGFHFTQVPF